MAITRVRWKRGTAADWTSANPVLRLGEPGWETDTHTGKVGDGVTGWSALPYSLGAGGGGGGGSFDAAALASVTHAATSKTSIADADEIALIDSAASNGLKKTLGSTLKTVIQSQFAVALHALTSKTTPVDGDEIGIADSAASFAGKRLTWVNLKTALKGQISLDQWTIPAANIAMNSKKFTGLVAGTADNDSATVGQMTAADDLKIDSTDLADAVLSSFNGMAMFVLYNTATSTWPTVNPTLAADTRAGWIFLFSDEGDPPPGAPTVAGPRLWARLVSP